MKKMTKIFYNFSILSLLYFCRNKEKGFEVTHLLVLSW